MSAAAAGSDDDRAAVFRFNHSAGDEAVRRQRSEQGHGWHIDNGQTVGPQRDVGARAIVPKHSADGRLAQGSKRERALHRPRLRRLVRRHLDQARGCDLGEKQGRAVRRWLGLVGEDGPEAQAGHQLAVAGTKDVQIAVAGGDEHLLNFRALRQLPGERVLAAAVADDQ